MKKKSYFVLSVFLFLLSIPSVFSQETITVTTYYPSPTGVYGNLRFLPTTAVPACDANNEGVTYYDNTTNLLMICRQTGTAPNTYGFQSAGSLWTQAGTTGPNGADPIAIRPFDTNLKVGIGDVNVGWNRQNRLAVTDNTSTNGLGEQIALMEILNPRRGNSGTWSGGGDSVTALLLSPGGAAWQVRADEFSAAAAPDSADAGAFMIHQTVNGNPATRLVIRNNGDVGIGTQTPQAKLDVVSTTNGFLPPRMNTAQRNAMRGVVNGTTIYNTNAGRLQVFDGTWRNAGGLGAPDFDSDWQNWQRSGPAANERDAVVTHNLGTTNVLVYLIGRDTNNIPRCGENTGVWEMNGNITPALFWQQINNTTIDIHANNQGSTVDQFRVRMWIIE